MCSNYQESLIKGEEVEENQKCPHYDKLQAALSNNKCTDCDVEILEDILNEYQNWKNNLDELSSEGQKRVFEMADLLNEYKNYVARVIVENEEAEFLRRQKGQLKIESSITEEFLIQLMNPDIITETEDTDFVTGPRDALLSVSFTPRDFDHLAENPNPNLETKDQDFVVGTDIFYKFSTSERFSTSSVDQGKFTLSVLATECKRHLDKTMYRESVGTAAQLKNYVPFSKYYIITDFLDMRPQNPGLTALDNVFILRKAKRLSRGHRKDPESVNEHLEENPVSGEVIWKFVKEVEDFLGSTWYAPEEAVDEGSFI